MDFNRLTEKVQSALQAAQSKAVRNGQQQIDIEHLLAALLEQEGGLGRSYQGSYRSDSARTEVCVSI